MHLYTTWNVLRTITGVGTRLIFLPPYSPDLNPIEEVFAKVKRFIKEHDTAFQCTSYPHHLFKLAFATVTPSDFYNYVQHAGYLQHASYRLDGCMLSQITITYDTQ